MTKKAYIKAAGAAVAVAGLALALPAFAQVPVSANTGIAGSVTRGEGPGRGGMMRGAPGLGKPAVSGSVTAVSGNTVTVENARTNSAYTVDVTSAKITKTGITGATASNISVGDNVFVMGTVSGTSVTATSVFDGMMRGGPQGGMMKNGVMGTVSAVSGTTLAVSGKQGFGSTTASVSYTVDASAATVTKAGAASSVSAIAVGDMVSVQGTVTGTSVAAKMIRDGVPAARGGGEGMNPGVPPIAGNGQPIVAGKVTSISGNSISITNNSNVSYTIDATSAKITKQGVTAAAVSNISVGDSIVVQGTVNGSAVTASSVLDGGTPAAPAAGASAAPQSHGFLGGIRSFFGHLFGF